MRLRLGRCLPFVTGTLGLCAHAERAFAQAAPLEPPRAPAAATDPALASEDELVTFEETATVAAPPAEVTRHAVSPDTIRRLPGTRGDALRGIEVLPGVARTTLDDGSPILRGAAGYESVTLLDGTPVPFLYHFGGVTSFLSPRFVERLELYPGNFPVRYGRVAGGALNVRVRDPDSERLRAAVDLSLLDSAAYVEAPLGDSTHVAAAVRRSNIDFFFEALAPEDSYSVVAAPLYYDYQALAVHRFDDHTRLRVMGYGSRDSLRFVFSEPNEEDPALSGDVQAHLGFHRLGVTFETEPSPTSQFRLNATLGYLDLLARIGPLEQALDGPEVYARAEGSFELAPSLRATLGADLSSLVYSASYRGPYPGSLEGEPRNDDPLGVGRNVSDALSGQAVVRPGFYVDLGYRPLSALTLTPGVRVDYFHELEDWTVDPRLGARYELSDTWALKAGVGYFTQAPEYWQSIESVGNPDIEPYRALQASFGLEQNAPSWGFGVEGFYKRLERYIVATENREAPHFTNDGEGRIYGAELSARATLPDSVFFLAYTLSRSERKEAQEAPYRLFDADQTHLLSLVASHDLGKGWEIGARFRLASGNPTTPIVGAVYDARTGLYVPRYGAVNSERTELFHQLDLRVEKVWRPGPLLLALYLDVQNVYNAQHVEELRYAYDYSESEAVTGLPFFPNLGFRGEL